MCDLFWQSPGEQGDLSDVVRSSLHPLHHHQLPTTLGSPYLQPEEEYNSLLLQEGSGGGGLVVSHGDDEQLGMVAMMMMGGNTRPTSDHRVASTHPPTTTVYPQARQEPLPGMIRRPDIDREGDVVVAPEIGDRLQQMSIVHHPRVSAAMKPRKSHTKKVVCIPAPTAAPGVGGRPSTTGEVVPSDLWAWRKYGQKPIKGSPYPRGYYRCSSSKGCPARKQVERSRTDPNMLVITYTSDHNHPWPTQRNALAGSTRPVAKNNVPSSSSAAAAAGPTHNSITNVGRDSVHHQLKQEDDLDLFADMDALNIFSSITKIQEDDSKEQLFDPFSSSFSDYL
ncbi:uncharacterized protein [Lolium perenne]|uniref:uncharacterized protein n=1 Tax=Lolium perenne TaxID=4522 RepID=UPI0021EB04F4|nr:uncharacterized protein LOC127312231 [Lolium perenne]